MTAMRLKTLFKSLKTKNPRVLIASGAAAIVLLAGIAVILTHASGFFSATEPESGTVASNATVVSDSTASGGKAIQFNAPVVTPPTGGGGGTTGACAVSTTHVPDGPDGMGGCWPGPSNTGPNAAQASMAAYTGSCTVTSANTVIDSKVVNCSPLVVGPNASGLVIKNSYVLGGVIQDSGTASFTIQDSILDNAVSRPACTSGATCSAGKYACGDLNNGTTECGVGYQNFTILRTEVMHSNRGAYCESHCTIQDSYFHGTNLWPDKSDNVHASGVRNEQYLTLKHTTLGCDYPGPFTNGDIGCSADVSGYPDFVPIMHDTIDSNLFLSNNTGTGFCVYGGGTAGKPASNDPTNATYIVFSNNVFQRGANGKCGSYGPVTDFKTGRTGNVWTNNKYDNGATVDPA
jgi:hypothetical protein